MENSDFKRFTQEGPRKGESLQAPACSPRSYSGGDKNRLGSKHDDTGTRIIDTDHATGKVTDGTRKKETRAARSSRKECTPFIKLEGDSTSQRRSKTSVSSERKRARSDDRSSCGGEPLSTDPESDAPAAKVQNTPRRGRGRPPTTGAGVGRAAAKAAAVAAQQVEMEKRAEELVARMSTPIRSADASLRPTSESETDSTWGLSYTAEDKELIVEHERELENKMENIWDTVQHVAERSAHLSGPFKYALTSAVASLKEVYKEYQYRTSERESDALENANTRQRAEIRGLRKEIEGLRKELKEVRAAASPPAPKKDPGPSARSALALEELEQRIVRQVGDMVNARLAAMEERLLPEKRARPPLAADRSLEAQVPVPGCSSAPMDQEPTASTAVLEEAWPPLKYPKGKGPGKGKGKAAKNPDVTVSGKAAETRGNEAPPPHSAASGWTEVTKKGRNRKRKKKKEATGTSAPKAKRTPKPRIRVPRTSAVVFTIQPGAAERGLTYKAALEAAKERIDLEAMGIEPLGFRTAATGGKVMELAGEDNAAKANSLAMKLREVFPVEDVRITRPEKCAELRISGLDDSVTKEDVALAISAAAECPDDLVKVSDIRRNAAGNGTAMVRCPAMAARRVAKCDRLKVGWSSARICVLDPRPLRCFRCLVAGHVREQCKSEVDRSSTCYRCSRPGHNAGACTAEPHCALCAAAGKPAEHRIGGKGCPLPPRRRPGLPEGQRPGDSGRRVRGNPAST